MEELKKICQIRLLEILVINKMYLKHKPIFLFSVKGRGGWGERWGRPWQCPRPLSSASPAPGPCGLGGGWLQGRGGAASPPPQRHFGESRGEVGAAGSLLCRGGVAHPRGVWPREWASCPHGVPRRVTDPKPWGWGRCEHDPRHRYSEGKVSLSCGCCFLGRTCSSSSTGGLGWGPRSPAAGTQGGL